MNIQDALDQFNATESVRKIYKFADTKVAKICPYCGYPKDSVFYPQRIDRYIKPGEYFLTVYGVACQVNQNDDEDLGGLRLILGTEELHVDLGIES